MILNDLLDLVNKEKRKRERVEAVQKFAAGMGVVVVVSGAAGIFFAPKSGKETRSDLKKIAVKTVESIKDAARKSADTVKDSVAHTAKDIHETAENISSEINKHVK